VLPRQNREAEDERHPACRPANRIDKEVAMARVFVTGSTDGLGLAAARELIRGGHDVVLHARSPERAAHLTGSGTRPAGVVVGNLASAEQTRRIAEQVNTLGRMDAIIHNAGVYAVPRRDPTQQGYPLTLAVNAVAPYVLTALIERPSRLIYLSSDMHRQGDTSLHDVDWTARRWDGVQAYCDSKLLLTALAYAVARRWSDVRSNAVDPGWVPTRMGGAHAPDDFELGYDTQVWLASGTSAEAQTSGGYWHHRRRREPLAAVLDEQFQEAVLDQLGGITGVALPAGAPSGISASGTDAQGRP
jgi:NAD(P)-dependent dehydrogenase (short-subunit alcohol dehydrogenase family)